MKKPVNRLKRSENIWGWAFVAPTLFAFLALTALPFVISILLSFVDWNFFSGLEKIKWVGLQHFVDMWEDDKFTQGLKNTFYYVVAIVPLSIVLSLVFAYCMNGRIFGKKALRMMFFIPYICSVVAIGAVFKFLFREDGTVNNLLISLGLIKEPLKWAIKAELSKIPIVLLSVWCSIGYQLILFTAAMQNVPTSLYEAAKIDGANSVKQFTKITLPMISPTIFYLVITRMMAVFKIFGSIDIFTAGTSIKSNISVVVRIYNQAFGEYNFGYASAMSMILFGIILTVTAINFWGQKKWVHY